MCIYVYYIIPMLSTVLITHEKHLFTVTLTKNSLYMYQVRLYQFFPNLIFIVMQCSILLNICENNVFRCILSVYAVVFNRTTHLLKLIEIFQFKLFFCMGKICLLCEFRTASNFFFLFSSDFKSSFIYHEYMIS